MFLVSIHPFYFLLLFSLFLLSFSYNLNLFCTPKCTFSCLLFLFLIIVVSSSSEEIALFQFIKMDSSCTETVLALGKQKETVEHILYQEIKNLIPHQESSVGVSPTSSSVRANSMSNSLPNALSSSSWKKSKK